MEKKRAFLALMGVVNDPSLARKAQKDATF
jgi:hypothetical protein